ncbi:MAG: HU family DNA-binding protein [Rhodospirillaceae bacterium]|nr:HU family DNA-binding protein [Rhodospirillaceae bacterium]HPI62348.1 HU family DNA-binding protein [Alphaproteobacteria bacterium]
MNKNDLINVVAEKTELSKAKAGQTIDAVFAAVEAALTKGDDVRLVGFGTFSVIKRKAVDGRNPRTGAAIKIPASKQAKFRPGKGLKDSVNKKK